MIRYCKLHIHLTKASKTAIENGGGGGSQVRGISRIPTVNHTKPFHIPVMVSKIIFGLDAMNNPRKSISGVHDLSCVGHSFFFFCAGQPRTASPPRSVASRTWTGKDPASHKNLS
jgi:hypothetical protein